MSIQYEGNSFPKGRQWECAWKRLIRTSALSRFARSRSQLPSCRVVLVSAARFDELYLPLFELAALDLASLGEFSPLFSIGYNQVTDGKCPMKDPSLLAFNERNKRNKPSTVTRCFPTNPVGNKRNTPLKGVTLLPAVPGSWIWWRVTRNSGGQKRTCGEPTYEVSGEPLSHELER